MLFSSIVVSDISYKGYCWDWFGINSKLVIMLEIRFWHNSIEFFFSSVIRIVLFTDLILARQDR